MKRKTGRAHGVQRREIVVGTAGRIATYIPSCKYSREFPCNTQFAFIARAFAPKSLTHVSSGTRGSR
jgi:hypothetical protein